MRISASTLTDQWLFQQGDTWASWLIGQPVEQHAPSIVSRGIELPIVAPQPIVPFVAASRHPNGSVAIATLPRSLVRAITVPRANITLSIGPGEMPIGIFGRYL